MIQSLFENQRSTSLGLRADSVPQRVTRLKKLKSWILNHKEDIRQGVFLDLKKSETETDITEIFPVCSEINKAIHNLKSWARPKSVSSGLAYIGTKSWVQAEPKGRCLIISPWNFPFQLVASPLVSCLAAGNTAICKPSEFTPNTSKVVRKMIEEVFDPSIVSIIEGGVEETQELLSLPFDHIFFTGSTQVGKIVMQAASKHLTSVTLELGGKSPVIIDETANLKDAAKKIAWGRFSNNGQTCIAPDYILIHNDMHEAFLKQIELAIKEIFDSHNIGFDQSENYTRIINNKQHERLISLIDDAKSKGASVTCGGTFDVSDRFLEPTVMTNINPDSRILKEEIFGPILPIKSYKSINEAIDHINAQPKPLSLYLFSKSSKVHDYVLKNTSSGTMAINDVVVQYTQANLPFGGVNNSGIGKAHGHYGFLEFSNQKGVLKQRIGFTNAMLLYPPFTSFKKKLVELMIKYF